MSTLVFVKEVINNERRCALLPANAKAYVKEGAQVVIESGIGSSVNIPDSDYQDAGAEVVVDRRELLARADFIMSVQPLGKAELEGTKQSVCCISFLDPFNNTEHYLETNPP